MNIVTGGWNELNSAFPRLLVAEIYRPTMLVGSAYALEGQMITYAYHQRK